MQANPSIFRLLLVLSLLVAGQAQGQPAAETLEPFPQSRLETQVPVMSPSHLVLLSPVREVNNQIRSETVARIPVKGIGELYEIRRDSNRAEAREYYRQLLQAKGAQTLFECSGRSCGRSNVWANQIFNQATLYGRDADQDYLVAAFVDDDGKTWLTLVYTIKRGNQREYVWVEHLRVGEGAIIPGLESASARIMGPLIVPWTGGITYRFDWNATDRRTLNSWASAEGARVVLTSFSSLGDNESLEDAMARAEQAAQSLSQVLDKTGVSQSQQMLIIVGPAVVFSDPARRGDRVEVVVIGR